MNLRPREQRIGIGGLALGLVLGIAIAATGVIPGLGTVADEDSDIISRADEATMIYYQLDMEAAEGWLNTYLDAAYQGESDVMADLETAVAAINQIAARQEDPGELVVEYEIYLDQFLGWTQTALSGTEEFGDDFEAPKDAVFTSCLALDDDPWNADPAYSAGIRLYVQVPVESEALKVVEKDWEDYVLDGPQDPTDLFWTAVQCQPTEEDA